MIIKFNKYKKFILDLIVNTFSFAIYIAAQTLILMPVMGKLLNTSDFANYIIFISIFSIISNSLGSELGIVRQIKEEKEQSDVYNKILRRLLYIIFIISIIIVSFLHYNLVDTIFLSIAIVLANLRLYASAYFRMYKDFKKIFLQNFLYLIGIVIGLFIYKNFNYIWIPSILAESLSLIYSIVHTDLKSLFKFKKVKIDKKILINFKDYSIIEFLINMVTYFDKILIYPILGSRAVNVYYSTSTMSKLFSLITNPLQGVILSWLKKDKEQSNKKIIKLCLKYCIPVVIFIALLCIPTTYLAVKFLYSQYLNESLIIIIPISIGVGFTFVSSIIKSIVLKFVESKQLLKSYIIYLFIFIALSFALSKNFGLLGFAFATMISRIPLVVMFLLMLKKLSTKGVGTNEN